ncbi:substrate-binding domain-containing protein [Litchfieldia salsa]|uniref:Ribose transport system substrate-binding protein n=1 Tax=Litchfieldia salsa TaxID=930152 RepID=A0A1H0PZG0_9BACI|nr:substrate-binding domain-containing protein [Litchfieldia salsa]SDP10542.1 ribose transport system substrate-binding protein [Litchfieldia salsa]
MRKIVTFVTVTICVILFYFTFQSALAVLDDDWQLPEKSTGELIDHRIVLITQELDTPFWDKVGVGAKQQAEKDGARLEIWGSYGNNQEDFLKQIEIAIYSQVDGIIVQGLDTNEFKELTKVTAASYGIPVITVANDVPMAESLRRTYVGSNQYLAGRLIAEQLVHDMGVSGEVVLMLDRTQEYYQTQRLKGIQDFLSEYPNVKLIEAETEDSREQVIATTKDLLNRMPNVDSFIAVNAKFADDLVEEIDRRSNAETYYIYSFDDDLASVSLLEQGKIDGMIEQSPEMMGTLSVELMMNWLNEENLPLNLDGYLTDIRMIKQVDEQ